MTKDNKVRSLRKSLTDKRHDRAVQSRAQIVAAAMTLVAGGDYSPTANEIADAAGVSSRTLFRHFPDMDDLYRDMSAQIEAKVWPIVSKPLEASNWRDQLREMVDRRANVFEFLMPYRLATSLRRKDSDYLNRDWDRINQLDRLLVGEVVPPAVQENKVHHGAIIHILSFLSWQAMRQDQRFSIELARDIMLFTLNQVLDDIAD